MNNHGKKMLAPVIIAIIIVLYYVGFAAICLLIPIPLLLKLLFGIVPLALAGVMIYVVITRIREIRSGEEDDLSKY